MREEAKQTEKYLVSKVDSEGLNPVLTTTYQVLIEAAIRGEYGTWSELKQNVCGLFAVRMRVLAQMKPKYRKFILAMNELGVLSQEGQKVYTTTNTINFDFNNVFEGIDLLAKGKISKNKTKHGELSLYPVRNFPTDMKKQVIYQMLSNVHPDLLAGIKQHELPLYITEDFHLAVGCKFWDHEDLTECIGKHRQFNFYQFSPDFKMYVLDMPLDR